MELQDVNAPQREAIEHGEGPLLILAGAGSGKTRVITHRIARLIASGVPPWRIFAVTFTNKAAGEMRRRVAEILGGDPQGAWIATFHAASARILRRHAERVGLTRDFVIYDDDDQRRLITKIVKERGIERRKPAYFRSLFDRLKNKSDQAVAEDLVQRVGNALPEGWDDEVLLVFREYTRRLRQANAVDFGDLILYALQLARQDFERKAGLATRFQHVMVDEFQDTNRVQYLLAHHLSSLSGNLCVVGDDDQSIYSWRGADLRNILDFERDHPGTRVIKLEQNYRSTQSILRVAHDVIEKNIHRKEKQLWTDLEGGGPVEVVSCRDEREESRFIAESARRLVRDDGYRYDDVAVFYRVHAQSRVIEEALRQRDIPYAIVGGLRFYERAEIKDVISYLRLVQNPRADLDFERVINVPRRGVGKTTLGKVNRHARGGRLTLFEAARQMSLPGGTGQLSGRARNALRGFVALIDELREAAEAASLADLAALVVDRTNLLPPEHERPSPPTPDDERRWQNLEEFLQSVDDYQRERPSPPDGDPDDDEEAVPVLAEFLSSIALASDADTYEAGLGRVALMTVHAAKGLEFPAVFISGLEDRVFPLVRGGEVMPDPDDLEEERRLAYVAITRAERKLVLSYAVIRRMYGREHHNPPSRFLREIPREHAEWAGLSGADVGLAHARPRPTMRDRPDVELDLPPLRRPPRVIELPASGSSWPTGLRVRHKTFGVGTVRACVTVAAEEKLSIFFPAHGVKTIYARFVERIE